MVLVMAGCARDGLPGGAPPDLATVDASIDAHTIIDASMPSPSTPDLAASIDAHTIIDASPGPPLPDLAPPRWVALPVPTGNDLRGVWTDRQRVWAVGAQGTILFSPDDGATWQLQPSGTTADLEDVAGVPGTSEAFAVGRGGTMLHYGGGVGWTPVHAGVTVDLHGICMSDRFLAVGDSGTVLTGSRNTGGWEWTSYVLSPPANLRAVATAVSYVITPPNYDIVSIASDQGLFAIGAKGWQVVDPTVMRTVAGVNGASDGQPNVFALGDSGQSLISYDGAQWSPFPIGATMRLNGAWGASNFDCAPQLRAVGAGGLAILVEGSCSAQSGVVETTGTTADLYDVWYDFAVGDHGTVLHRN